MDYSTVPQNFSYQESYAQVWNSANRNSKEYYLRNGNTRALPHPVKFLNFYLLLNNIAVYFPSVESIKRTTNVEYYLSNLISVTRPETDEQRYNYPFMFDKAQRDAFGLEETISIRMINVSGQIQDVFERHLQTWAQASEATEQLGISLALKLTPKHRVRVYTRDKHVFVFTTKGLTDVWENDYAIYRKLWACLPLMFGWEDETIVELCKALDNTDATHFWELLEQACNNCEAIKDLKYSAILQAFNSISTSRQAVISRQISDFATAAQNRLNEYARTLESKRDAERRLFELQNSDKPLETNTIKMLVDKKICYNLNIDGLTNMDNVISFRCSAPLLSYDKDAAKIVYHKRITPNTPLAELFRILFIEEKAMLMLDQAIDIKLARGTFTARNGNTRIYNNLNECFPNPHHYYYNCWGSYGPAIIKLINEYNLEEMFYQIKAAMGSLNFTDYPVVGSFIEMLDDVVDCNYNPNCFYWADENYSTPHTAGETLTHFREETAE